MRGKRALRKNRFTMSSEGSSLTTRFPGRDPCSGVVPKPSFSA
jgi:hypothetical protein